NLHSTSSKIFEEGINQYIKIISSGAEKIQKFFNDFDKMTGKSKDKLLVLVYPEMINSTDNKDVQEKYVHVILEHLNKIDPLSALDVFEKIKDKIPDDEILRYAPRFEIPKIIHESKNMEINKYTIEKILNQVSDGTSDSRLMLLNEVIDARKEEFLEKGAQLLNDTRNSYYKPDIYKIFVENDYLHKCIFEVFESNSKVSDFNKKQIFEDIFLLALEIKPELVMLLLNYMVYDLTDKYDAENFEKIIKKLNKKYMMLNFDKEFDICVNVFSNIEKSASKQTLNMFENPESIKQLVKSTKLLTEFVDNTSWDDELDDLQRSKLVHLKTTMGKFINKNNKKGLFNFFD
ncbi:MAG: hypothetical protein OXC46_09745, partial [Thaumarchaeota archaeon]|nr:hypothetical protein [Nitrososphaerota archaeon]